MLLLYPVGLSGEVFEVHANGTRTNTRTVFVYVTQYIELNVIPHYNVSSSQSILLPCNWFIL